MPEVRYTQHEHQSILLIDLSHLSDFALVPPLAEEAIRLARSSAGPGSLLTLVDLSGTRFNGIVITSMKNLSKHNGRYAKATAFVGLSTTWALLLTLVFRTRGTRNHRVFRSRNEAIAWLQQQ